MRWLCLTLLAALAAPALSKACQGQDLPKDGPVRIGVLQRAESCPKKAEKGDRLSIAYVGKLYSDCEEFDRSGSEPFKVTLGKGKVIKGWEEGLRGMCVGEKRKLTIPSELAYGEDGSPPNIHEDATLVFEVELLKNDGARAKKKGRKKKSKRAKAPDEL